MEAEKPESCGGLGGLLLGPTHIESDLNMLRRAIAEDWPIAMEDRPPIIARLRGIVAKKETMVMTKDGIEMLDGPADRNAIAAAAVLERMVGTNQDERHFVTKLVVDGQRPQGGGVVNNFNGPAQVVIMSKDAAQAKAIEEAI